MRVLMLSSSRVGDEAYLDHAIPMINQHLAGITDVLFVPFAGVSINWDDYTAKVQTALPQLKIIGLHQQTDAKKAIQSAPAILVGGGNTFNLLHQLYEQDLLTIMQDSVKQGVPYIGWSAGSNICGNSIRTTNDMPIIQPKSFAALNFVPFQINPHYTDYQPPVPQWRNSRRTHSRVLCLKPHLIGNRYS
ncbi:dipeptidase PepE [Paraglaciecola aquimarina]|uniref:Dipeptidase PepE n=1 Tax=Paraglaciecola aquimarina TaxID=1235557 RepID=A0ABU3SZJ5_9ALTE|nr:dipeptidase PepE [Paraglaciecola aquimarina]MDU0355438.1 dipeptidase PepE [Paraglaciecola aquimarina]